MRERWQPANGQRREPNPQPVGVGSLRRAVLALALATGSALAAPQPLAHAFQAAQASAGARATPGAMEQTLAAECQRLRSDLERANAEISSLKRGDRGVRDDYRLRRRMADAEQLARQLTAAEADLRRLRGPSPVAPVPAAPKLEPGEAPGVLEARADLLSDQARRLSQQAAGLERVATQLQTRQTLRRRAGQVERDPFGAMDGSKRFMIVRGAQTQSEGGPNKTTFTGSPSPGAEGGSGTSLGPQPTTAPATPGSSTPPPAAPTPTPATGPGDSGGPGRSSTPTVPTSPGTPTTASEIGARALIDPAIAAELRRLDTTAGAPASEAERLKRAASMLTRKAEALEAEARALRTRAKKR